MKDALQAVPAPAYQQQLALLLPDRCCRPLHDLPPPEVLLGLQLFRQTASLETLALHLLQPGCRQLRQLSCFRRYRPCCCLLPRPLLRRSAGVGSRSVISASTLVLLILFGAKA